MYGVLVMRSHSKPIDTAWKLILSGMTSNRVTMEQLFQFSSDSYYAVTRQFSTTHRAVLKLEGLEINHLPTLLAKLPEVDINAIDTWGLTALSWAASRKDSEAVEVLLAQGADPDKADARSNTPLMRTTDLRCLELLLKGGASIDAQDNQGQTALFYATQSGPCTEMLLQHGASIDLVERSHGLTAAYFCVCNNRAEGLRVLLQHHADFRICAIDGSNLMHTAVQSSNEQTLSVLAEATEAGLVWDTKDVSHAGMTLRMLAEERAKGGKLQAVVRRLLDALGAKEKMETVTEPRDEGLNI